jgi:hypothetical protein
MEINEAKKTYDTAFDAAKLCSIRDRSNLTGTERQIAESQRHTLALLVLQNPIPQIYSLPNNILTIIVRFASHKSRSEWQFSDPWDGYTLPYNWNIHQLVKLTHVCSLFRAVIVEQPEFWTEIDLRSPPAVLICLERSAMRPLRIYCEGLPKHVRPSDRKKFVIKNSVVGVLQEITARASALDIQASIEEIGAIIQSFDRRPFPHLQTLRFILDDETNPRTSKLRMFHFDAAYLPPLVSISLYGVSISYQPPMLGLSCLTCLHLQEQNKTILASLGGLLSVLRASNVIRCLY